MRKNGKAKGPRNCRCLNKVVSRTELSGGENERRGAAAETRVWGKVACKNHESNRGNWSDSLCKSWSQAHTVDQTVHPPNKHSFVSQRLLVGRWPPAYRERQKERKDP